MSHVWRTARLALVAGVLWVAFAGGQTAGAQPLAPMSAEQANEILQGIQTAAQRLNYQGVFSQQQAGAMHSFRVTHRFDGIDEFERLEVLDDSPREYLRKNHRVQCLVPERKLVLVESQRQERFPALLMAGLETFGEHYQLVPNTQLGRVAGRDCVQLSLVAKDEHRHSYHLCADKATGLLLKAQVRDPAGVVLEQIAFSQVSIGSPISDSDLAASWSTEGWRTVERTDTPVDFRAMGWKYVEPPGYRSIMQLARTFRDGRQVSQVVLSDGLARISIFVEPFQANLSHHQSNGASRSGSVNLYGKRVDDYWVVVVGEVPAQTIKQLAQSIDRAP